ncbi:MAG: T9SS C-terminal target domain-containing protein [Ignavibacteriales bacterium]|nr:MAG: T9SS C-terminal target domain-containing protein [Ignavibacteriales bacterium]
MKKIIQLLAIFLSISNFSFGQDAGEICSQSKIKAFTQLNKISQVQYPGDSNIDVTYYKLNLSITYGNPGNISGIVTVDAKATQNQLATFFLDIVNQLTVTSVKLNGITSLTFSQPSSSDQLRITLDRAYGIGEKFSVDISYQGIPGSGGFGSFIFATHNNTQPQPIMWTLSEPYGAKDWWPSKDTPGDKADSSDVWITAASNYVSVSNGKLISETDNGNGTKTYKWKNSYPIAGYLISLAMTNYSLYQNQFNYGGSSPMPVTHYVFPENLQQNISNLDNTVNMLQIFSQKFGPYPFLREKYGHAQFGWGGGMEHQTVTSIVSFDEMLVVHELAHQWYGDKVTCKDWQNIWLNEGFASYCECIYREVKYGTADFKSYVNNFMNNQNNGAKNAVGTIYVQNINDLNQIFNSARSYKKGAIVLHMLRGIVGDDNFFKIMQQYANEPGLAYNVATTEDFQRIAERVSGMNLNYFFQEWIHGENFPVYFVVWSYKQDVNKNYKVSLKITQSMNSNPGFFTMPIQIAITTSKGLVNKTVINNAQVQSIDLIVDGIPSAIQVDPGNWILKTVMGTTYQEDFDLYPTNYTLDQNYPNPFNSGTSIRFELPIDSYITLNIYDELGSFVTSLINEKKSKGIYEVRFDPNNYRLASGIYFYTLKAGNYSETKKMIILK